MKRIILTFALFASIFHIAPVFSLGRFGDWTCSVALTGYISDETGKAPNAFLWIPEGCEQVNFAVLAQQNMTEEALLRSGRFRKKMKDLGGALIWVAPWFSQDWSPATGSQQTFEEMMVGLAGQSNHKELTMVPVVPFGHSAQATFPWNFAAWNPERTLAIISFHGDAPRTNLCGYGTANVEWGRTRNIDGIPGLMIEGEYEWWQARVRPALAFQMMYPKSCISLLCDVGSGHFDICDATIDYIGLFIQKVWEHRGRGLRRLNPSDGWRYGCPIGSDIEGDPLTAFPQEPPASWNEYTGDPHTAFWYIDEEMARLTAARYAETDGKEGQAATIRKLDLRHLEVGDVFSLGKESVSSLLSDFNSVFYICGPLRQVGFDTFEIIPYDCGTDNPKRSHSAWIVAVREADTTRKRIVQPIHIVLK
ncbi:MAG: hypothetical protein ACI4B5_04850 [Bacteroidaceae bacterium]